MPSWLPVDRFEKATTWQQVVDNLTQVATEEHDRKTVVLDTLGGAAELAAQHICATLFAGDWGPRASRHSGRGWERRARKCAASFLSSTPAATAG